MEDVIVLDELKKDIESTKKSIDSIIDKLNYLEPLITETHTASMDIYYGTYVTEWIEDLKKNGTSSETYKTPLRMEYLATYPDAVNNVSNVSNTTVEQIIFDYAIENNLNIGDYFTAKYYPNKPNFPEPVETIDDIIANTTSFAWLCVQMNMNRPVFSNQECLGKIFDNKDSIGYILKNNISNNIYTKLKTHYLSQLPPYTYFTGLALVKNIYLKTNNTYLNYTATVKVTLEDGSVKELKGGRISGSATGTTEITVNGFITKIECTELQNSGSSTPEFGYYGWVKP